MSTIYYIDCPKQQPFIKLLVEWLRSLLFYLVTLPAVVEQVQIAYHRQQKRGLDAIMVGNDALDGGHHSSAQTAITSSEDPWLVYRPRSLMASVKIFDHMIELKRPINSSTHMEIAPFIKTATSKSTMADSENAASTLLGWAPKIMKIT